MASPTNEGLKEGRIPYAHYVRETYVRKGKEFSIAQGLEQFLVK